MIVTDADDQIIGYIYTYDPLYLADGFSDRLPTKNIWQLLHCHRYCLVLNICFVTIKHHLPTTWRDMDSKFTSPSEEMTMSLLGSNHPSYQFWVKGIQPFDMDVTLQVLALFPF